MISVRYAREYQWRMLGFTSCATGDLAESSSPSIASRHLLPYPQEHHVSGSTVPECADTW